MDRVAGREFPRLNVSSLELYDLLLPRAKEATEVALRNLINQFPKSTAAFEFITVDLTGKVKGDIYSHEVQARKSILAQEIRKIFRERQRQIDEINEGKKIMSGEEKKVELVSSAEVVAGSEMVAIHREEAADEIREEAADEIREAAMEVTPEVHRDQHARRIIGSYVTLGETVERMAKLNFPGTFLGQDDTGTVTRVGLIAQCMAIYVTFGARKNLNKTIIAFSSEPMDSGKGYSAIHLMKIVENLMEVYVDGWLVMGIETRKRAENALVEVIKTFLIWQEKKDEEKRTAFREQRAAEEKKKGEIIEKGISSMVNFAAEVHP